MSKLGTFKQFCEDKVPLENDLVPGDKVKNTNPKCKHYKSEGTVEKVEDIPEVSDGKGGKNTPGKLVVYKDEKTGKKLKKTGSQLSADDTISEWVHILEKKKRRKKKKKKSKKRKMPGLTRGRTFGWPGWFGGYYGGEGSGTNGGDGGGGE